MTFSIKEVKDGPKYKVVDSDLRIKDEMRYFKEGYAYNNLNYKTGCDLPATYDKTTFTLVYPTSIEEAAKHLDDHCPEWVNKIDLNKLDPSSVTNCVLGQLYGNWSIGMKYLYNLDITYGDNYSNDGLFGSRADWKQQIELRSKKEDIVTRLTFIEATQALAEGKRVRPISNPVWGLESYMYVRDKTSEVLSEVGSRRDWFVFKDTKFIVVPSPFTFKDLKAGQKFVFINSVEKELIRAKKENNYFIPRTGEILNCGRPDTDEVKVIND